ncbi:ferredoxin [Nocardioides sp. YIM 152315]|uniref:ferredoxin n=1 Tax=Nocardioides sp. YIM 152315 TaxID=3031760 RepID=UPI0023DB93A6|nr:ferredoxin [Nocardioides sp. YIM 152315]MDF1602234.1 ferredoxin [Nocardioides sp. YIM 152315]
MKLTVDRDKCSGHGRCYSLAPDYFDCDDEGYPVILNEQLDSNDGSKVTIAVDSCPERAVTLKEGSA